MVFSTDTILNTNPFISENKKNINEECSFVLEALELLSEENRWFISSMSKFYNTNILNEGFAGNIIRSYLKTVNPKNILINIINSFINLLDKIWRKIESLLLNLCNPDHIVKLYKNKLNSIQSWVNYPDSRLMYTNLGSSDIISSFKSTIDNEYDNLIDDLSTFKSYNTYEKLYVAINNLKNDIDMTDNYFDQIRGIAISGTRYAESIYESEFSLRLYNHFRNEGKVLQSGSAVTAEEIREMLDDYLNFNKYIKIAKREKDELKKESEIIKKKLNKIDFESYINESLDSKDISNIFISVIKNEIIRVKKICEIFTLFYTSKIDAMKEKQIQSRKILFYICKKVTEEGEL